jgi:hypothetical protein
MKPLTRSQAFFQLWFLRSRAAQSKKIIRTHILVQEVPVWVMMITLQLLRSQTSTICSTISLQMSNATLSLMNVSLMKWNRLVNLFLSLLSTTTNLPFMRNVIKHSRFNKASLLVF